MPTTLTATTDTHRTPVRACGQPVRTATCGRLLAPAWTRRAVVGVVDGDDDGAGVPDPLVEDVASGVGDGQPRADDAPAAQPRVPQHLLDRAAVSAGHH